MRNQDKHSAFFYTSKTQPVLIWTVFIQKYCSSNSIITCEILKETRFFALVSRRTIVWLCFPGSERFYHNKNQIFFNKSCCYGPLLDPDKVSQLPEATPPGKVSSVIRTGLEMVAKAAFDPEKVIDLMQEGCGVRVVVKHKGKILKKVRKRTGFHIQWYMFINWTCPIQTIRADKGKCWMEPCVHPFIFPRLLWSCAVLWKRAKMF